MEIYKISAVTLIKNMQKSCSFYSQIPGFKLVYGGSSDDTFSTFEIGKEHIPKMYLNLELRLAQNFKCARWHRLLFRWNIVMVNLVD